MAEKINFLLGQGELLTERIPPPPRPSEKAHPYTFEEAKHRLHSKIIVTATEMKTLPQLACPGNMAVASLVLHPAYLAKSYFPAKLLETVGLETLGSRPYLVVPQKWSRKAHGREQASTTELFVAGQRNQFEEWGISLSSWKENMPAADDLRKVEDFRIVTKDMRIRPIKSSDSVPLLEVVLHASALPDSYYILDGFREFLDSLEVKVNLDERLHSGGLCFLPVRVPRDRIETVANFSFLRVLRGMPKLRPVFRSLSLSKRVAYSLPAIPPMDQNIRVAVFDGGLPETPNLRLWCRRKKAIGVGHPVEEYRSHGLGVTSALLFGSLVDRATAERPFAFVDHYRVLDENTAADSSEDLFNVVRRIQRIIVTNEHDFANLSVGPDLPVEDDEVHVWTAVLDPLFASRSMLATIAAGNSGENDWQSGNARIQSPADCLNGLSVGACDSPGDVWRRASYSSVGPGRRPGIVKPDILAFGGSDQYPYWIMHPRTPGLASPISGTSFAAPTALRMAVGIRAHLGPVLTPLTIKALLVHHCEINGQTKQEAGWGRIPNDVGDFITCGPGSAHIVYQGQLQPAQWLRAKIPVPQQLIGGFVEISATFCFATDTDPQDPVNYSRSGLEIVFRPNRTVRKKRNQTNPNPESFFKSGRPFQSEGELRRDAQKWENVLHASKRIRAGRINDPVFDVHYIPRAGGRSATEPRSIPYALIVTVRCPSMPDIYDQILLRYRNVLRALTPAIQIPIRT